MSEKDLIRRIRTVDPDGYGQIIRRYRGKVMGTCYSYLKNQRDAEEAAQDIFVKVYFSLGKFKGRSSFSTWIYRVTVNHCLDLLRKRSRRKMVSIEALGEKNGDPLPEMAVTAERTVAGPENRQLVQKILSILPKDHRTILFLQEGEGLKIAEIAERMVCTPRSVRRRSSNARKMLRESQEAKSL